MRFLYLANIRLPTEKAHGLQIMQNCEAFAQNKAEVTLIVPRRRNTRPLREVQDVWGYYGVRQNFAIRRLACLDFMSAVKSGSALEKLIFLLQTLTFTLVLTVVLLFDSSDVYYSRDTLPLIILSFLKPRQKLIYEAHYLAKSRWGSALQRFCARRVNFVVAITGKLAADLQTRGARRTVVAHDGIRRERFENMPDPQSARRALSLPPDAFIVGYVGQLHILSMNKGVDTLIAAISQIKDKPVYLCLVGGPNTMADALRAYWKSCGLPDDRFLFLGQVHPLKVPTCLAALDVCAIPSPWTEYLAYYTSPLKLFEYMAAGRAIVSTDLPAVAEVVKNEESALLVPAGNLEALADAIARLYADPALRVRLGSAAQAAIEPYTWEARTRRILAALKL
jgi:glycosyltransferase involved in cell wall biosynthesis